MDDKHRHTVGATNFRGIVRGRETSTESSADTARYLSELLLKRVTAILRYVYTIQYRRDRSPRVDSTRYNDAPVEGATAEFLERVMGILTVALLCDIVQSGTDGINDITTRPRRRHGAGDRRITGE